MRLLVTARGFDSLSLGIKALQKPVQDALRDGVRSAAMILTQEAKDLVPVKTGRLQTAIHDEVVTDEPEKQERSVRPAYETGEGFDPPYARRIEMGFIGTDSIGRRYHQPAKPFMRPAFDSKQEEAKAEILDHLNSGIELGMEKLSEAARRR